MFRMYHECLLLSDWEHITKAGSDNWLGKSSRILECLEIIENIVVVEDDDVLLESGTEDEAGQNCYQQLIPFQCVRVFLSPLFCPNVGCVYLIPLPIILKKYEPDYMLNIR